MRVVRAFSSADGAALVHLHNVSGGVLGGDQLWVEAEVQANARAQITTTGATRVYRQRADGATASQVTHFAVQQGALLEYLPDMLIPFSQARYQQKTRIELGPDAGLFYWEVVAPGREAKQELFAYDQLRLDLDIWAGQRPLARERVQLEPKRWPVTALARLGPFRYYGTFYICRVGIAAPRWLALETELTTLANQLTSPGEVVWGVSTLAAHGLVVRAVSQTNRLLTPMLPHFWQLAKQALYQTDAIMPRKIY